MLASRTGDNTLTVADTVFLRSLMALVLLEFFADQQQWDYQQAKTHYRRTARPTQHFTTAQLDRGFITTGLWRYSRHPNFAAEQAIWVLLYQWCCYETFTFYNWTFVGAISYLLLFQGSTWFTEMLSSGKYPGYKEYQRRVGRFLPKLIGERWDENVVTTSAEKSSKGKEKAEKKKN